MDALPAPRIAAGAGILCSWTEGEPPKCWLPGDRGALDLASPSPESQPVALDVRVVGSHIWTRDAEGRWSAEIQGRRQDHPLLPRGASEVWLGERVACWRGADAIECAWDDTKAPRKARIAEAAGARQLVIDSQTYPERPCGRFDSGEVVCWSRSGERSVVAATAARIAAGARFCVWHRDGTLDCTRDRPEGAAGEAPAWDRIGTYAVVEDLQVGASLACAQLARATVSCWWWDSIWEDLADAGTEYAGELRGAPFVVSELSDVAGLAVGAAHACATDAAGTMKCWGRVTPIPPREPVAHRVPLTRATAIAVGGTHACAIQNELAWCWGDNHHGQLGQSRYIAATDLPKPVYVRGAVDLALGRRHTCVRTTRGDVSCWGDDSEGQTGRMPKQSSWSRHVSGVEGAVSLAASGDRTCVVDGKGQVLCWGTGFPRGKDGKLARVAALDGSAEVSIVGSFVCGRTSDRVTCVDPRGKHGPMTPARSRVAELSGRCLRRVDGTVACFAFRETETYEGYTTFAVPTDADGIDDAALISDGCVVRRPGDVVCLDEPDEEVESLAEHALPTLGAATHVARHQGMTCAVSPDGAVSCVGSFVAAPAPAAPDPPWTERAIEVGSSKAPGGGASR